MGWHISTGRHHPQPLLFWYSTTTFNTASMYLSVPVEAGRAQAVIYKGGHISKKSLFSLVSKSIHLSLRLLPATSCLGLGPLQGFLSWHIVLQAPSTLPRTFLLELATRTHSQIHPARHRGPLTPKRTTDLNCLLKKMHLFSLWSKDLKGPGPFAPTACSAPIY